ncbi:hypothetical protein [Niabella soli]|uniref:Uncharacterized protein n=1 Tax=Niabella soli DSM 19437 TaxID=929713 RepID=W0F3J4_9BACT|nr:hypothetical protein [Niabella soli]AHF17597.1 hypothetical protein NIASO_10625 [Niabella soli DSM 19437]
MKRLLLLIPLTISLSALYAQKTEGIYAHLYTDSLKKGTYNYINIDGKMSDGSWKPLTDKELLFKTSYGRFEGNNLVLPDNPATKKVTVTATLRENTKLTKTFDIWIKQLPDPPLVKDEGGAIRSRRRR